MGFWCRKEEKGKEKEGKQRGSGEAELDEEEKVEAGAPLIKGSSASLRGSDDEKAGVPQYTSIAVAMPLRKAKPKLLAKRTAY